MPVGNISPYFVDGTSLFCMTLKSKIFSDWTLLDTFRGDAWSGDNLNDVTKLNLFIDVTNDC